ncbi:uncharacterized protein LOC122888553 [Siniperca chuatsi]|uniref:uncharacterized protein LOC122888553 n=1 Tax=Siniperca chuatsi TaxID=119488 RepID=UPI001CE1C806|nr:uncharacterized protein LOC122888553 [Siniperca chuatsi]
MASLVTSEDEISHDRNIFVKDVSEIPELNQVPSCLWAQHKYDVGLIKDAEPVVITPKSSYRPCQNQYPLKKEAVDGIKPVFDSLLKAGVIIPCANSPVRTPIFPVRKLRDAGEPQHWRFVQDLQAMKEAIPKAAERKLHDLEPGDWIVVKDFRRKNWRARRWNGPYQILLTTETAVKVAERATWIHATHCKRVPEPGPAAKHQTSEIEISE